MGVDTQEIIDLTEDDKVIVVGSDSDDGAPTPAKRSISRKSRPVRDEDTNGRSNQPEENSQAILTLGQSTPEAGSSSQVQEGKQRKPRRKKKRKQVVLAEQKDGEEGEIVEVDVTEESAAVSREQSSERIASGSGEKSETKSKRKHREQESSSNGNGAWVSGQDVEAMPVNLEETNGPVESTTSKRPGKHERKRKRRERERESELPSRPRSRSPESPPLFFVDNHPAEIPSTARPPVPPVIAQTKPADSKAEEEGPSLLLPPHVFILEGDVDIPVEILPPPPADSDEDDYIEYLDYDDDRRAPGVVRYFDDLTEIAEAKASKTTRIVCKNCGAEGEHKTYECPIIICLTCGARDEHSTRSCPVSKTCFSCGMKGHVSRTCPNRFRGRGLASSHDDCDRCGSGVHNTNECPTLWRMYEYVDDSERQMILTIREEKRDLAIGEGGEGYIAPEDWCYNCGGCGHLGDDCNDMQHPYDFPREPSAFSEYNTMSGPFYDAVRPADRAPSKAATYAAQAKQAWGDGYGSELPLEVGKQGRNKARARLEKRAQELQEDDGDDWFANRGGNGRNGRNGGEGSQKPSLLARLDTKKLSFGNLGKDNDRNGRNGRGSGRRDSGGRRSYHDDLPQPMRETDSLQIRGASRRDDDWNGSIRGAASRGNRDWDDGSRDAPYEQRRKERSRHRDRRSPERRRDRGDRGHSPRREPRYRGGYSR